MLSREVIDRVSLILLVSTRDEFLVPIVYRGEYYCQVGSFRCIPTAPRFYNQ
jgi:hypothetical protein